MPTTTLRIAIIGAGPGGLILARLLQVHGIPFSLYELDASRHSRSQGGTLDIHGGTGQKALAEAGLYTIFRDHARQEGAALRMLDTKGAALLEDDGSADDRPEIDREVLRNILLDSLEDGAIQWGKWGRKVVSISEDPTSAGDNPKFIIQFADGTVEQGFDLVVGADGAWSRVRKLLIDTNPFYAGVTLIEASIKNAEATHPDLAQRVGKGTCIQVGDHKALLSQRNGDGSIKTYAVTRVPEDWSKTCGIDWEDEIGSKEQLIEMMFKDWDLLGKRLVLESDEHVIVRPLYMLPVGMNWTARPGVTAIGDAAHLMTPFAGVGVNLAMTDALDLTHALCLHIEGKIDLHSALREFEEKMFTRAAGEASLTFANLNAIFGQSDAREIAKSVTENMTGLLMNKSQGELLQ